MFTGKGLQDFWDYFIVSKESFKSTVEYYRANPEHGTISVVWYTMGVPKIIDISTLYK
jgi:hypothetical protein